MNNVQFENLGLINNTSSVHQSSDESSKANLKKEIENTIELAPNDSKKISEVKHIVEEHLENEKGIKFSNKELKHCLSDSLCKLSSALEDVNTKKENEKGTKQRLTNYISDAINSNLSAVETFAQKGSDSNLTNEDKKKVVENLENSLEDTKQVICNPQAKYFINSTSLGELIKWISRYNHFINNLFFGSKEKEKRECDFRRELLKQREELCARKGRIIKQRKKSQALMEKEKERLNALLFRRWLENFLSGKRYQALDKHINAQLGKYTESERILKSDKRKESFNRTELENLEYSLPPSYICNPIGLNIDFHC